MKGRLINALQLASTGKWGGFCAKNKLSKGDFCLFSLKSPIKKLIKTHTPSTISEISFLLVITKGQGVWATMIRGPNAFAPTLCFAPKFHLTDGQNTRGSHYEGQKAEMHDQIMFCAFHSFLVEVQKNAGYIHCTCNACVITWRLGLQAPLVARNKAFLITDN